MNTTTEQTRGALFVMILFCILVAGFWLGTQYACHEMLDALTLIGHQELQSIVKNLSACR